MSQITIYIDNDLEAKVKKMASETGLSISKFISGVLEKNITDAWSSDVVDLSGSWNDFPSLDEIRDLHNQDVQREDF